MRQWISLVYDEARGMLGKLSSMDGVKRLEPNWGGTDAVKNLSRYRRAKSTLESLKDQFRLWLKPLSKLCKNACAVKVD